MKAFVIGGAGFIGSHLVDSLLARGDEVTAYDNMSVGRWVSERARLVHGDALDMYVMAHAMAGHDAVFHLSANPEARRGLLDTALDMNQGTVATYGALEAARLTKASRFVFASSGTVYGDSPMRCAEGDLGDLPVSLYGASKLAGEALVSAYSTCFGLKATVLRFGNVVGSRATHGCILDFLKQQGGKTLRVLGDGSQTKPYLHVSDCVRAILHCADIGGTFNVAPADETRLSNIAQWCAQKLGLPIEYGGGSSGWLGDIPVSRIDSRKLIASGFKMSMNSDRAAYLGVEDVAAEVLT